VAAAQEDADRRRRFEELVAQTYEPIQRYLRRRTDPASADDVLGDVLLVLWRRLDDVPPEAPLPWAYGVARGCLANNRRSAARQERVVVRLARAPRPAEPDEDGVLAEALDALPDADRELLRLWAWERLTPAELAQVLGITANAASIRLHRAKGKLRKLLLARKDGGATGHPEVREEGGAGR
jgi:RNA polymerase sigma-70 factor (ECF subfamily)